MKRDNVTKKTLYMDKESLEILDNMPPKKQSDFTRKAIKEYHYNSIKPVIPEKKPLKILNISNKKVLKVLTI